MSDIGWPKASPVCGGWRASPLSSIRARAMMWLTKARQDQVDARRDGGVLELWQMWTLCRTSSTSSPAEGTRSTVHNNRGLYSMRYLRPLRLRCCRPSCWTWRGHRGCQRYWIPRTRSLVKLPEVSEIRNMLRARANSHLLVVELCRTSSTSSPAEKERSTAHYIGEFASWDT